VPLREYPHSEQVNSWITGQLPQVRALNGEFYRVAGPRYTTAKDIVSGVGAMISGGRWNPPEIMRAVYLSRHPRTAILEATARLKYHNIPFWKGMPSINVGVQFSLHSVCDLVKAEKQNPLPQSLILMMTEDWHASNDAGQESVTQALGRLACEAGIQGLLVPSKQDSRGMNIVIFPELLTKDCLLEVLNAEELDKLGRAE
jgi:RES domain-containing protein